MSRRGRRLLALLACRDETRYLPGWLANVTPHVDGVVALDDGSTDGSAELLAAQPAVVELIRRPPGDPEAWDDAANHRLLVEAAWEHPADWLLAVDADERLERDFRRRAEAEMERADREGHLAYYLHVRELWGSPATWRSDGPWAAKRSARLFRPRRDHQFHEQRLHCHWAPLQGRTAAGDFPQADLVLYHLRMIRAADRLARRDKYRRLDPERREQAIGYDHLTDEAGLELTAVEGERGYEPIEA
ncbi:MAG TPA: glycosyltransferase family 2 protein [Thermoanaerobaculia bacterium]